LTSANLKYLQWLTFIPARRVTLPAKFSKKKSVHLSTDSIFECNLSTNLNVGGSPFSATSYDYLPIEVKQQFIKR